MLPILVVHGQIDDERHLTCHFGMLSASAISNGRCGGTATPPTLRITSWRRRSARFLAPELRYRLGPAHAQRASASQLAVSREAAGAGSEISAVGVWGVSMSMRVRHGLRARGALVSTPLFEIQAAYRRPTWAGARTRDLVPMENSICLLENPTTIGIGWEWGERRRTPHCGLRGTRPRQHSQQGQGRPATTCGGTVAAVPT